MNLKPPTYQVGEETRTMDERVWIAFLFATGAAVGTFSVFIFALIYWFQKFDMPVTPSLRFRSAFFITAIILLTIIAVFNRKVILQALHDTFGEREEDEDDTEDDTEEDEDDVAEAK